MKTPGARLRNPCSAAHGTDSPSEAATTQPKTVFFGGSASDKRTADVHRRVNSSLDVMSSPRKLL